MIRTQQALPPLICCLLAWNSLLAQDAPPPTHLSLVVLQGEGEANRAGERVATSPSVRVEDQNNMPVSNAAVVFTLPTSGPSGEFEGGAKTLTVLSNDKGVADAGVRGLKANDVTGQMQILVNVTYRGQTANTVITEFIVAPNGVPNAHHGKTGKIVLILALVAGGAAGAVLATRKSSSPSGSESESGGGSPSTIILTLGTSSVGAPH
ncbi:MAG TPA: hypothetical protein VGG72_05575 [Bryobacteraceae bacterium]|jgi:hypothetical protein